MTDETIKPALRSGELASGVDIAVGLVFAGVENDEVVLTWRSTEEDMPVDRRHALAALALHGQPYGFTVDDIVILHAVADQHAGQVLQMKDRSRTTTTEYLRGLAERIAALLPPEA